MAFFYYLTFLAILSTPTVWGYSSGAPATACSMVEPKHPGEDGKRIQSQSAPAPYKFTLATKSIAVGDQLKVQLISTGTEDIQGFIIQAHLDNNPVGTFMAGVSDGLAQNLKCIEPNDSLTHNLIKDSKVKSVNFIWTPSNDLKGKTVKLIGTVAAGYNKFWVKGVTANIQVA